jgi:DNA-binding response OmpR family regulator
MTCWGRYRGWRIRCEWLKEMPKTARESAGNPAPQSRKSVILKSSHPNHILTGGLVLDMRHLQADAGRGPVSLTRLECLLLKELAQHPAQPLSRDVLLATVWGPDFNPSSNVVDACVRRLRSKVGFELIKTVRGTGYQLTG